MYTIVNQEALFAQKTRVLSFIMFVSNSIHFCVVQTVAKNFTGFPSALIKKCVNFGCDVDFLNNIGGGGQTAHPY